MEASVVTSEKRKSAMRPAQGHLQLLSDRLARVEEEIAAIRRELSGGLLQSSSRSQQVSDGNPLAYLAADNAQMRRAFDRLFRELSIEGKPIPAEDLQNLMGKAGLERNELSHAITAAREE